MFWLKETNGVSFSVEFFFSILYGLVDCVNTVDVERRNFKSSDRKKSGSQHKLSDDSVYEHFVMDDFQSLS